MIMFLFDNLEKRFLSKYDYSYNFNYLITNYDEDLKWDFSVGKSLKIDSDILLVLAFAFDFCSISFNMSDFSKMVMQISEKFKHCKEQIKASCNNNNFQSYFIFTPRKDCLLFPLYFLIHFLFLIDLLVCQNSFLILFFPSWIQV